MKKKEFSHFYIYAIIILTFILLSGYFIISWSKQNQINNFDNEGSLAALKPNPAPSATPEQKCKIRLYTATWCGPCKKLKEKLSKDSYPCLIIEYVDVSNGFPPGINPTPIPALVEIDIATEKVIPGSAKTGPDKAYIDSIANRDSCKCGYCFCTEYPPTTGSIGCYLKSKLKAAGNSEETINSHPMCGKASPHCDDYKKAVCKPSPNPPPSD